MDDLNDIDTIDDWYKLSNRFMTVTDKVKAEFNRNEVNIANIKRRIDRGDI